MSFNNQLNSEIILGVSKVVGKAAKEPFCKTPISSSKFLNVLQAWEYQAVSEIPKKPYLKKYTHMCSRKNLTVKVYMVYQHVAKPIPAHPG